MKRILPIVFFLLVSPATAEELLKELTLQHHYDGGNLSTPLPIGVTFNIAIGGHSFLNTHSPDQIGQTFDMPPTVLAAWQAVLDNPPNGGVWYTASSTVPEASGNHHGDTIETSPLGYYDFQTAKAYGTDDWKLTRVTRTVDSFDWAVGQFCGPGQTSCDPATTPFSVLAGNARNTIRLYGFVVPEPASVVLLLIGAVAIPIRRRFA